MRIGVTERGDGGLQIDNVLKQLDAGFYDGAIIITKHPGELLNVDLPNNTIVHATITGLGGTLIEPGVPTVPNAYYAYDRLVSLHGPERVILRIDPILLWGPWKEVAKGGIKHARGRVRISFLDAYDHVRDRFKTLCREYPDMEEAHTIPWDGLHAPLADRMEFYDWAKAVVYANTGTHLGVCGEPGIPSTGCISVEDIEAMGLDTSQLSGNTCKQRILCSCVAEKTEMLGVRPAGGCPSKCIYCYWKG